MIIEDNYKFNMEGKSASEIRSTIRGLKQAIGRIKNNMENPILRGMETPVCSNDDVIYDKRWCLQKAIRALENLGENYVLSKREQKAADFDAHIDNIEEIVFYIGSCFGPKKDTVVRFDGNMAKFYEKTFCSEEKVLDMPKEYFVELFRNLYIGEWDRYYSCNKYGVCVFDGIQWELAIKYSDGMRDCVYSGDNCYPYNFSRLLVLMGRINEFEK